MELGGGRRKYSKADSRGDFGTVGMWFRVFIYFKENCLFKPFRFFRTTRGHFEESLSKLGMGSISCQEFGEYE